MAGNRGYRTYRGKSSRKKAALAVLLLLVILTSVVVALLQEHIVYDATGAPRLEIPWREESSQTVEDPVDLDLVIQPVEAKMFRGFTLPLGVLTPEACESALLEYPACNAVAVILKDVEGTVYFDSQTAPYHAVGVEAGDAGIRSLMASERRLHTVAQLACFQDSKAANGDVEGKGLKNTEGFIFYDGSNSQWLDPAKPAARQYLCRLAVEAAELGFREILLTHVGYPTEGRTDRIQYGEGGRAEHLRSFLTEMREVLAPYEAVLAVELPEAVLMDGRDELAGIVLAEIAPLVDRIYTPVSSVQAELYAEALREIREELSFIPLLTATDLPETGDFLIR